MDIIHELEAQPRGIYSGTIGRIGVDGSADLNIVIRTALILGGEITVSAGGAIIALSDPDKELEEVLIKVNSVCKAIDFAAEFKNE